MDELIGCVMSLVIVAALLGILYMAVESWAWTIDVADAERIAAIKAEERLHKMRSRLRNIDWDAVPSLRNIDTPSDQPGNNLEETREVCKHGVPQPCILGYPGCICADEALLEELQEDS